MGNSVPDNQENDKLCICPTCPTYMNSQFSGNVFCATGKAAPKAKAVGCPCANCPVYRQYSLNQLYYCVQGKSSDLK